MSFDKNKTIDIHTHVFNLKYLPIWGVLNSRGVGENTSKLIEFLLLKITGESFDEEVQINKNYKYLSTPNLEVFFDSEDEDLIEEITYYAESNDEIRDSELLEKAIQEYGKEINNDKQLRKILNNEEPSMFKPIRWLINKALKGFAYLRWFIFMTKRESKTYESLRYYYPNVNKFVFHMLDTEFYFPGKGDFSSKPHLKIEEQMNNMLRLMEQNPNKLVGFFGYNPERENRMALVKEAIRKGFTGIKFYPPLGYNPIQSEDLFEYCEEKGIPIFTHCTPTGFEAYKGAGENANPKNWEVILKKFKKLKLCLGHAGGVNGWFDKIVNNDNALPESSYAKKVVELCQDYENVYTEVGFLDHIESKSEVNNFVKRLVSIFNTIDKPFDFKKKIMYGSDFHVLMNHKGNLYKNYSKEFTKILDRQEFKNFKTIKEDFFYNNAEKFLNKQN
ncbi:amidohydrolase family protein [Polaribacter sp. PL03]|uniref:amidohydrolase family protein n=1 Tax=Polaribacter sp. PL03 TaxID=3088353 RepID=UPI0029D3F79B|nr:amidohydrolase family protein [Polaribacter sp. PL03]MDX6745157.1 amidohydrolase family protein [Polaribacter sp. PL03]